MVVVDKDAVVNAAVALQTFQAFDPLLFVEFRVVECDIEVHIVGRGTLRSFLTLLTFLSQFAFFTFLTLLSICTLFTVNTIGAVDARREVTFFTFFAVQSLSTFFTLQHVQCFRQLHPL